MRRVNKFSVLVCVMFMVTACGGGGGSSTSPTTPTSTTPSPPTAPPEQTLPIPDAAPIGDDFHPDGKGWDLVWSDEFEATELDTSKWAPEISCWGGGNNERQCYTDREDNIQLVNGLLRLIAVEETFTGPTFPPEFNETPATTRTQDYTSGKVRTRDIADWKYGRFSARMKLPAGQGTWPAFWMLPAEDFYGTWPLSGEVDILESVNLHTLCTDCRGMNEDRTIGAIHFGDFAPQNSFLSQRTELADFANPADGYHVYSVEWGEGKVQWFVDDQLFFEVTASDWFTVSDAAIGNDNAPFDRNFYLMFNFAVGGNLPENTNALGVDSDAFPSELLIDWVRVYQCGSDLETGLACMSP